MSLAAQVSGPVFQPGDDGYSEEVTPTNLAIFHTPDVVVGAASTADVAQAVRFAIEHGYRVTVQGAGHGAHTPITSGVLVTTRRLDRVEIDPSVRFATIGAGARWDVVVAAAAEHGLFPVVGSSAHVGVVGYLMGGGLGPMVRSHGFSSDYLESATVVTGTGEIVEASAESNPELLWGLRGGGKTGLGIVTEVRVRLIELSDFYAGAIMFDEPDIDAALRAWFDWTATADPEVSTSGAILRFPPFDTVPPPLRGRRVFSLRFTYPGSDAEGERLAAPLRAAAPVYLDALGPLPVTQVATIHSDPTEPAPSWVSGLTLDRVDGDLATLLLDRFGTGTDAPFVSIELRHLGSAAAHDVDAGSAVGGRSAGFVVGVVAVGPDQFAALPGVMDELEAALAPWASDDANINFMGAPRSDKRYATAWPPATTARLAEVRARYDPAETFAWH